MALLLILASFVFAALISLVTARRSIIESVSVIAASLAFASALFIAIKVAAAGVYVPFRFFSVDALGAIVLLIVAGIGLATVVYSVPYFQKETAKNIVGFKRVRQYYVLLNLFIAALFCAITVSNPIFAFVFVEATTLSTALLISFYNKPSAIEAAWKYLIINSVGILLGFFGTLLYFINPSSMGVNGSISWQLLAANAAQINPLIARISFVFVLIGYGTKVGFAPMHTWKPDAYSKAPAPLGAMLSGAVLPAAFLIILKFRKITDLAIGPLFGQKLFIIFGLLSIVIAAVIMLTAKNYKRLLAYSCVENAGVIALGFGFGGLGTFAAILHLIYYSCVKVILFFSAGNLLLKYSSSRIINIKGALGILPVTSVLFISGFLMVTGLPPAGTFLTKMFILSAGMTTYPAASLIAIFGMTIVFVGFLKHVTSMFFGSSPESIAAGEGNIWLIIPPLAFLAIIVCLSFYIPPFLHTLINSAVQSY